MQTPKAIVDELVRQLSLLDDTGLQQATDLLEQLLPILWRKNRDAGRRVGRSRERQHGS